MNKRFLLPALVLLVGVTTAIAANVHFVSGPTVSTNNRQVTVCGKLAGLGNQDVRVVVSATATTICTNRGNNVPPGQTETVSGSVSRLRPENGTVSFCVTSGQAGNPCPSPMRPSTTFTNIRVQVYQGGKLVLDQYVS